MIVHFLSAITHQLFFQGKNIQE